MKVFIFFALLLLFSSFDSSSQTAGESTKQSFLSFFKHDTLFIRKEKKKFVFGFKNVNWLDDYDLRTNDSKMNFRSDLCYNAGPSVGYKFIRVGFSVNLNELLLGQKLERTKFDLNLSGNIVSAEFSFLKNKGQTKLFEYKGNNYNQNSPTTFNGLNTTISGVSVNYYFNHKRYSNSAAYADNHYFTQLKSAGSLITGFSFTSHDIIFDLSELNNNLNNTSLEENEFSQIYSTYCINVGYGYNFVIRKNFMANITVIPSVGIKIDDSKTSHNNNFTISNKSKIAFYYNLPKYFIGFNSQNTLYWHYDHNNSLMNTISTFNVLFGWRF